MHLHQVVVRAGRRQLDGILGRCTLRGASARADGRGRLGWQEKVGFDALAGQAEQNVLLHRNPGQAGPPSGASQRERLVAPEVPAQWRGMNCNETPAA